MYANVYRNAINDGDSQTSPFPIFPEGGGTSVHRLSPRSLPVRPRSHEWDNEQPVQKLIICYLVKICLKH